MLTELHHLSANLPIQQLYPAQRKGRGGIQQVAQKAEKLMKQQGSLLLDSVTQQVSTLLHTITYIQHPPFLLFDDILVSTLDQHMGGC